MFSLKGGGTPSTNRSEFWQGNIPWISSSDLIENDIYLIKEHRFITFSAIENSSTKLIPEESILVVTRVGVGKVAVNQHALCVSQDFTCLTKKTHISSYYFAYLVQKLLKRHCSQGSTIKGISSNDIADFVIWYPDIEEQNKIYFFLKLCP